MGRPQHFLAPNRPLFTAINPLLSLPRVDIHICMPRWAEGKIRLTAGQADADGSQEINLSVRKIERSVGEGRDERGGRRGGGHHISGQQNDPGNFFAMAIWRIGTPTSAVITYEVREE